jgi:hypothetical protein
MERYAACSKVTVLETIKVGQLKHMLHYLFETFVSGISSIKKDALLGAAKVGLEAYKSKSVTCNLMACRGVAGCQCHSG